MIASVDFKTVWVAIKEAKQFDWVSGRCSSIENVTKEKSCLQIWVAFALCEDQTLAGHEAKESTTLYRHEEPWSQFLRLIETGLHKGFERGIFLHNQNPFDMTDIFEPYLFEILANALHTASI